MQDFIKINKDDNVAVALKPIAKGTTLNVAGTEVTTIEDIPQGHKFVIKPIKKGDAVIKYGFRIGFAQADIEVGGWVHTHNLKTALGELLEYTYNPEGHKDVEPTEEAFFEGYMRENGTVGVRNEVWIIPTVGCVNSIARAIEATARANKPEGVDEVVAFPHPYGCSQVTEDQENTRHVLADLINHPNAGAVLVLGLGCENSRIEVLKDYIGEVNPDRVKFLQVQDVENEQEAAEGIMKDLMSYAATFKREKVSAKHLIVGMKCGGSDGLSGITANPTVGLFSDMGSSALRSSSSLHRFPTYPDTFHEYTDTADSPYPTCLRRISVSACAGCCRAAGNRNKAGRDNMQHLGIYQEVYKSFPDLPSSGLTDNRHFQTIPVCTVY